MSKDLYSLACKVFVPKGFNVVPNGYNSILVCGNGWSEFSISFAENKLTMYVLTERGAEYAQSFHDGIELFLRSTPFNSDIKDGTPLADAITQHAHTGDEIFQINQREYLVRPVGLSQILHLTESSPGGPINTVPLNQSA